MTYLPLPHATAQNGAARIGLRLRASAARPGKGAARLVWIHVGLGLALLGVLVGQSLGADQVAMLTPLL